MASYKNIEIDDGLIGVIRHMDTVEEYREVLQGLQLVWDNLTLLGQMSGAGTDMTATRQSFNALTGQLINQLGAEILKKSVQEMRAKAQVAIDILVRNLFERTADIGFLATDDDIRRFVANVAVKSGNIHTAKDLDEEREALRRRFSEYVAKYSVYSDIVLLDIAGTVLARLDDSIAVGQSAEPMLQEALSTAAAYVESYGNHDLLPGRASLIYAYRVCDAAGEPVGVLCLCFRLEDEMAGIFANLGAHDDWSVITLLDSAGRVVASSDAYHVPLGAPLEIVRDAEYRIVRFAGQEYLAATCATQGYQGYLGPGWVGHAMLPVQHAFNKATAGMLAGVAPATLASVMNNPSLFGQELRSIPEQAQRIQADLNRSVWNGNVRQVHSSDAVNASFSKTLLWEISKTGARTEDVFERSIANLHETVVSSILQDSRFLAALAIDIMDRNLYERANDCRWWALTTTFRELLARPERSPEDVGEISRILDYINGLYTVYSNLFVFDAQGRIVAVSRPGSGPVPGTSLNEDWVRQTLTQTSSQGYTVSAFAPTPLYGGQRTYIYGAAIRSPDESRIVGGIGIVFDSAPQFAAMLSDTLPGEEMTAGAFALFSTPDGEVIACSGNEFRPGDRAPVAEPYLRLRPGEFASGIVEHGGRYFAIGARGSKGYREFKGPTDAYRNDVVAIVCQPLCEVVAMAVQPSLRKLNVRTGRRTDGPTCEIATFHIGGTWLGMRAEQICEAVAPVGITAVPGAGRIFAGYLMYGGSPVPVYDIGEMANAGPAMAGADRQVIVLQSEKGSHLGILVDGLGEIPEIAISRLQALPAMLAGGNVLAESIVGTDAPDKEHLLIVLSAERIIARLLAGKLEIPPPPVSLAAPRKDGSELPVGAQSA